jgi:hypothetical protein
MFSGCLCRFFFLGILDAGYVQRERKDIAGDCGSCAVGGVESDQGDERRWVAVRACRRCACSHPDTEASKGGQRISLP